MLDDERDWEQVVKGGTGGAEPPSHFDLHMTNHIGILFPSWFAVIVCALLAMTVLFAAFTVRELSDIAYYLSVLASPPH